MVIIVRAIMENCRYFVGHITFEIANTMCHSSIFSCVVSMISNFSIIYIFKELFDEIFSANIFCIFMWFYLFIYFLLTVTFFPFQNQLYFLRALLKIYKTLSYNLFHDLKYFVVYVIKSANYWHWISTTSTLPNLCC